MGCKIFCALQVSGQMHPGCWSFRLGCIIISQRIFCGMEPALVVSRAYSHATTLGEFSLPLKRSNITPKVRPDHRKHFEQIFKAHFAPLCGFAAKYVGDLDDAKNIVHEVFISVWDKFQTLPEDINHKSYLYTAVKNKSLNFIRDRKKHIHLADLELEEPVEENLQLEAQELEKEIELGIASLPEKCREIFQLNRQEGLKYSEIADRLGISIKTVEAQMSKALAILREQLKNFMFLLFFLNGE